jgi:hypothetical protein
VGYPPAAGPAYACGAAGHPRRTSPALRGPYVLRLGAPTLLGDEPPRPLISDQEPFAWTIDEAATWPPRQRPHAPFGPGTIEVLRSCPLRGVFQASDGYEPRMGFAARVGTTFHRTLQWLVEEAPDVTSPDAIAARSA